MFYKKIIYDHILYCYCAKDRNHWFIFILSDHIPIREYEINNDRFMINKGEPAYVIINFFYEGVLI